jgi:DNA-binding MarR family transcriptional regulator
MYVSECRNRRVTVGDACLATRAPQTTALRAIQALVEGGCIERSDDTTDSRRKLLSLTAQGRDRVARFIDRFTALEGS